MKLRTLRKISTKEFIHIQEGLIFTCSTPHALSNSATYEIVKEFFLNNYPEMDFDDIELVEFDLFESGVIGADIRNKLSPSLNLISLIKLYLKESDEELKMKLKKHIEREIKNSEIGIKYIANLL